MFALLRLRLEKILYCLLHSGCWRALSLGVAPSLEHQAVIRSLKFDRLIDVGANRGQFSLLTRMEHPAVSIVAFEPIPHEAAKYRAIFGADPRVTLKLHALGSEAGTANLHLSAQADSSSLLPISDLQQSTFPGTNEVGTLTVKIERLDDVREAWEGTTEALLKIDVQGFELEVLKGAKEALKHCRFVYAECSELPLYTGQALYHEVDAFLRTQGFAKRLAANQQIRNGKLIQADYLFERR
jgi:FkbM family methyltransferase